MMPPRGLPFATRYSASVVGHLALVIWHWSLAIGWAMPPLPGQRGIRFPAEVERPEKVRLATDQPRNILVLLVQFRDNQARHSTAAFQELLFGKGSGSMADYYSEASGGVLSLGGGLAGWYSADNPYSDYLGDSFGIFGQFPHNSQGLVTELVKKADPDVDFARFDNDHDGVVDGLLVVHAGPGAEETGQRTDIWSHKWQLSDPSFGSPGPVPTQDGVSVDPFSVQPERFSDGGLITVGVFCHEFGHILGLPDLYDTDYSSEGLGSFCLMAAGSWARASEAELPGSSPVHPCAWCKYFLGWVRPESLERGGTESLPGARIPAASSAPVSFRILANPGGADWTGSGSGRGEYFLVENRQRIGFDQGLPGSGLLILHVDEAQPGNDNEQRPLVGILQADGAPEFALRKGDRGSDADLWKNSVLGVRNSTTPSTAFYDGVQTGVVVESISGSDSVMSASLEIAPLFLGRVFSFPNPVVVREGKGQATIVYQPSDSARLANRFPPFKVRLFNLAGEPVRVLDQEPDEINREHRAAFWDLRNEQGQRVKSGLFFYTVVIDEPDIKEENVGQLTIVR